MQELLKSWKEFEVSSQDAKNGEGTHSGPVLEIRIPSEYVTSTNRQVNIEISILPPETTAVYFSDIQRIPFLAN